MAIKKLNEHEQQVYVCEYLKKKNIKYAAIPNGFVFKGTPEEIGRYRKYMKAEGLQNGFPDMILILGNGKVAFLEMKTKSGKPSKEQIEWHDYFKKNNYPIRICKGLKDAIDFIDELCLV